MSRSGKNAFYYSFYYSRPSRCAGIRQDTGTSPKGEKAGNAHGIGLHRLSGSYGNMLKNVALIYKKSTHNRRECPVYGHRGGSRGRFYYRITTFEGRPWDAKDPHKTTFMTLKHAIRLSIWRKQKETPGVEKAPGVSSPQRKESGRSGRDDGELRFGYDPAIHARRLRVYHRPRRLRMALRISIILYSRRFSPANLMG